MLVSLDKNNNSAFVLQIPRDTYAEYTSASYRKLNAAKNVLDGGRQISDFFEDNWGINIDHFVIFNLEVVSKIVDALGGIEIYVPIDMSYRDPYQDLIIEIDKGYQVLNGEQSKQFVRFREGYIRGDLDRLDTQKLFLSALLKKVLSVDVQRLIKIAFSTFSYIESDLSYKECIDIVANYQNVDIRNIMFATLPGLDIRGSSGAWYYVMNHDAAYELISERFSLNIACDEFDKNRKFTSMVRSGFNDIYEAKNRYRAIVYSAEDINNVKIN
jgi:LCP family protein required for cell wall assembly